MALDDRSRLRRFEAQPRTDRSFDERVLRVFEALQVRYGKSVLGLDPALEVTEHQEVRRVRLEARGGERFDEIGVAVSREEGEVVRTRLTVDIHPRPGHGPSQHFELVHRAAGDPFAPEAQAFAGGFIIKGGAITARVHAVTVWQAVVQRGAVPVVVTTDDAESTARIRFEVDRLGAEAAFLAVRQLGRAFPAACREIAS